MFNDYRITPSSLRSAMERDGEMSRLRSQAGIRISASPCVSVYIVEKRVRAILNYHAKAVGHKEAVKIDRLTNKLDKLGKTDLEYLHYLGTEQSVAEMISVLRMTHSSINRLSSQWKKSIDGVIDDECGDEF